MRQALLGIVLSVIAIPNPQWMTYQFETVVLTVTGDQWTPEWSPWEALFR